MRKIYLVRHGKPDFPDDGRWCLGRTDLPLGTLGKLQASLLGKESEGWLLNAVFCSPLARARETAEPILSALNAAGAAEKTLSVYEDLTELDAGVWDGHSFEEIKLRWPDLYETRVDASIPIPGQEPYEEAQKRFLRGLYAAVDNSIGNIAIVAHTTVFCLALCALTGRSPYELRSFRLPYGSYTVLEQEAPGCALSVCPEAIGLLPSPPPDEELCTALLYASDLTSDSVVRHCMAVRDEALRIASALNAARPEAPLDLKLVEAAALLHDVARFAPEHEKVGAEYLEELGYPEVSEVIRQHKELDSPEINEAAVVFIADKCRKGELPVTVEQRFSFKLQSFNEPEALASAKRRYALACEVRSRINGACGSEIIRAGSFEDAFA